MRALRLLLVLVGVVSLSACQTIPKKDYSHFREINPRSVLVVPAVNQTVEVEAADYFLSTVSVPLADRGFYVFPVHLVKRVMEDDGLADASMVHMAPANRLAEMFNADTVLYITIEEWASRYLVVRTDTTVKMKYVLKDGKTGDKIWEDNQTFTYSPNSTAVDPINLMVNMVVAAAERIAPNYMPLARIANFNAFTVQYTGLPNGPYSQFYGKDAQYFPSLANAGAENAVEEDAAQKSQEDPEGKETAAQKVGASM